MSDYTPTDEQIEALAKQNVGHDWVFFTPDLRQLEIDKARREAAHPAFQTIIRSAQAESLREFADSLGVDAGDEDSDYWQGYRNGQRQALRKARDEIERIEKEQTNER